MKKGIKELTDGMQRLCAVANRIVSDSGKTNRLEIDLLMDNLRRLYDVALMMRDDAETSAATMDDEALISSTMMATRAAMGSAAAVATPIVIQEPEPQPEPKPEHQTEPEPEPTKQPEAPTEPAHIMAEIENDNSLMFDEVIIEAEPTPQPEPEPEPIPQEEPKSEPVTQEEPVPESPTEPTAAITEQPTLFTEETTEPEPQQPSLLDYLRHPTEETPTVRTIGDTLRESSTTTGIALERKVSDLRTVININDKFSFMTELFRGNMKAYNDFIMQLNELANRDEAMQLVKATAAQYHWDESSLAVSNFYKVFDKKF